MFAQKNRRITLLKQLQLNLRLLKTNELKVYTIHLKVHHIHMYIHSYKTAYKLNFNIIDILY